MELDARSPKASLLLSVVGTLAIVLVAVAVASDGTPLRSRAFSAAQLESRVSAGSAESLFVAENAAAMDKMMSAMTARPTGDVDADFVAMMIPHHQGAIDMAMAVLRHGRNEQIRRLAQEIIVTQQEEIAAMRLALGQPLPPSIPAPTVALTP